MKRYHCNILLLLLTTVLLSACGREAERSIAPQLAGLYQQLESSCNKASTYSKKVYDLNTLPPSQQDSLYQVKDYTEDILHCPIIEDLFYSYNESFEQEGIEEFFTTSQKGDTLIAQLNPNQQGRIQLQSQKILKKEGKFLYFESFSKKDSWLYNLKIHIRVKFTEEGLYQSHSLDIYNEVPLVNEGFRSRIEAKASYL
ncbi:MAG: hypothetical protein AAF696_01760 [Bacteroidota bacterium]